MKLACDIHTHTLYSRHAYSTVLENIEAARQAGLELLGITDHFSSMVYKSTDLRDFQYFLNMSCWPRDINGVHLLRGAEVDIVDIEGHLFGHDTQLTKSIVDSAYREPVSLEDKVLSLCDYAIASVHNNEFTLEHSVVENTEMYMRALDHPRVLVLGHIGRSGVNIDYREIVRYARQKNKLIEINNSSFEHKSCYKKCQHIAELAAEEGTHICVNTDAHIALMVGKTPDAQTMLEEINFPEKLIATRSKQALFDVAHQAGINLV